MVELQPVDAVEITLVVDNFVDILLAGAEGVRRFPLAYDAFDADQLVAEHGFSALVTVEAGGAARSCTTAAWRAWPPAPGAAACPC
ncbi:MAG TPA: hypothetical protein VG673_20900 [Actinomycetota bacterium]|nr:hypothetical protein [Actinomycetota bacterium]